MSRIGRLPVEVPSGVDVIVNGTHVHIKGPKGEMEHTFPSLLEISYGEGEIIVTRLSEDRKIRAFHGMTRALLNNMVIGVTEGFLKELELVGVGYRANMSGKNLVLNVGYSHPVEITPPDGITFDVAGDSRKVTVSGHDKQQVGQIAADIRKVRPPEPYKGKGIRYKGEHVRRKAGKVGKVM
ncbi:MAG: 50S ribosomal protein L6 [Chloroflexota bacterium]|nr:MAG: 50S ribosomal protein L6 [Chloroflexota bacterium]